MKRFLDLELLMIIVIPLSVAFAVIKTMTLTPSETQDRLRAIYLQQQAAIMSQQSLDLEQQNQQE